MSGEGQPATATTGGLLRFLVCGGVDDDGASLADRLLGSTGIVEGGRDAGCIAGVAWRRFSTARRRFIVADGRDDAHGIRTVATAAATADLAVLRVDAAKPVSSEARRTLLICSLFGVRHIVVAVDGLDRVGFDRAVFEKVAAGYRRLAGNLDFASHLAIPMVARRGDNLAERSARIPWYDGPNLLDHLETVEPAEALCEQPFRFPVAELSRSGGKRCGLAGTVTAGSVAPGDPVLVMGSTRASRVHEIVACGTAATHAAAGDAVTLLLQDAIDVSPGDLLVPPERPSEFADQFAAHVVWMKDEALVPGRSYWLRIGTRTVAATVTALKHRVDVESGAHIAARTLADGEVGFCNFATGDPVAFDARQTCRGTGGFLLIDRLSQEIAGAGVIAFALRRATNVHWHQSEISPQERAGLKGHRPAVLWFTGLSGAGKSTIANRLEQKLLAAGCHTMLLDGDNVRHGLNRDLGFTDTDRVENIRRISEVARLMSDAGLIVLCAFISPFRADRQMAREIAAPHSFLEVFVDTPIDECVRRDPKGLYAKAKAGAIPNFTGIDSAYEPPAAPEFRLATVEHDAEALADLLVEELRRRSILA